MNAIVRRIDGKLMAEIPLDIAESMGIAEGDSVDVRKAKTLTPKERAAIIDETLERHGEALRMLADR